MSPSRIHYVLAALSLIGNGTFAMAQARRHAPPRGRAAIIRATPARAVATPAATLVAAPAAFPSPTPFVDVHPFQSQIAFRVNTKGIFDGMFQVIPAVTVEEYKYRVPGVSGMQSAFKTALMYDKQTSLPEISVSGGNYTFFGNGYMSTIAADGTFFYKGKTTFEPAVTGGVFFTEKGTNNLVVVDSYGFYYNTFTPAAPMKVVGGNYYIDEDGNLTTIRSMGIKPADATNMVTHLTGFNFKDIRSAGGNFFVKSDGAVVTISSETGLFKVFTPSAAPKLLGGNYFIGMDDRLYTVAGDGNLTQTDDFTLSAVPTFMAYSMMRFPNGKILMVDGKGNPHDNLLRISDTGINVEPTKVLPYAVDPKSIYLPNRQK